MTPRPQTNYTLPCRRGFYYKKTTLGKGLFFISTRTLGHRAIGWRGNRCAFHGLLCRGLRGFWSWRWRCRSLRCRWCSWHWRWGSWGFWSCRHWCWSLRCRSGCSWGFWSWRYRCSWVRLGYCTWLWCRWGWCVCCFVHILEISFRYSLTMHLVYQGKLLSVTWAIKNATKKPALVFRGLFV